MGSSLHHIGLSHWGLRICQCLVDSAGVGGAALMATNATVKDALDIARSLLCDDLGLVWTDIVLFPKVKQAH